MVAMSNDGLAQTVREHGGRMTRQCRIILDTLAAVACHPTAGELHEMVRKRLPGISQGTVYRNLRRLQELGYVLELDYGAGPAHFDARVTPHHHVRCRSCGRVADIEGASAPQLAEVPGPPGWRLEEERVEFIGLCPECRADQDDQINQEG